MKQVKKTMTILTAVAISCLLCAGSVLGLCVLLLNQPSSTEVKTNLNKVSLYNSSTGEPSHRVLVSGSGHGRIAVVDENNQTIWELLRGDLWVEVNDADMLPNGDIIYCASKPESPCVRLISPDYVNGGYNLKWQYDIPTGAENHTCQAIDNNGFLIAENYAGYVRLVELDENGSIRKMVGGPDIAINGFSDTTGGSHGKLRQAYKTSAGTYMLTHMSKQLTLEIDETGTVLHSYPYGGFTSRKLSNGNVIISGGDNKMVTELTENGQLVWQLNETDVPGFTLSFPANITRLANGNTVIANWEGHGLTGSLYPIAEITPDKQIVWGLESGDSLSVSNFMILDDLNVDFNKSPDIIIEDLATNNYRSPLDVEASIATGKVYVADYTNKSVQVLNSSSNTLAAVISLTDNPISLFLNRSADKLYIAAGKADGKVYEVDTKTNMIQRAFSVGHTPSSIEISEDGTVLYVANRFTNNISKVDLSTGQEIDVIPVTREPVSIVRVGNDLYVGGHLPDGTASEDVVSSEVVIVDLTTDTVTKRIELTNGSTDLKDITVSADGKYVYASHTLGRYVVATTHLDRGWIYTNAISEISTETKALTATVLLDDLNEGAGNPWGIVAAYDKIYVNISGTREMMIIDRLAMREKIDDVTNGTVYEAGYLTCKEDIADDLTFLVGMKQRVPLSKEGPRGIALIGNKVYIAAYFSGCVIALDANNPLDQTVINFSSTLTETPARIGEKLWNNSTICYQKWQSCASCHPDARADGLNWDNMNDMIGSPKQAKSMLFTFERGRVMATGIRPDAATAVKAGMKYIMFNAGGTDEQYNAIGEYLKSLQPESSPFLVNGTLSDSAERGKALFIGKAGCASCHAGKTKSKDVLITNHTQVGNETRGLTVPPIVEVWRTGPYLYDGRAKTVQEVLTTYNPVNSEGKTVHGKVSDLTSAEVDDLVNYVMSLSDEVSRGDLNRDEITNVLDLILFRNVLLKKNCSFSEKAADYNMDSSYNIVDLLCIKNALFSQI